VCDTFQWLATRTKLQFNDRPLKWFLRICRNKISSDPIWSDCALVSERFETDCVKALGCRCSTITQVHSQHLHPRNILRPFCHRHRDLRLSDLEWDYKRKIRATETTRKTSNTAQVQRLVMRGYLDVGGWKTLKNLW
jgi:hypothetical protein